jgi:hypothetical protein
MALSQLVYFIPKSLTTSENVISRVEWVQIPGV